MAVAWIGAEVPGPGEEQFRLQDFLGNGAFGEVYRAIGTTTGLVVAVKLLPSTSVNEVSLQALVNEVRLASEVIHPNVVRILHVNPDPSMSVGPYLVMEYVTGGTLANLLQRQRQAGALLPLKRAQEMMIDIAQGARAINERLIHRDIKPDNILVDETRLKISDFGISKLIAERTRTHTFKGGQAVAYMAPEGWESEKNTVKLDVYSVGLVCYEILTLNHPLAEAVNNPGDWKDWRDAHLFKVCPDIRDNRPDAPLPIARLLSRMVSKRPQNRPDWDEIITILSESGKAISTDSNIRTAVEAAIKKSHQIETAQLAAASAAEQEARKNRLYQYACQQLTNSFQEVIDQFNSEFQSGRIEVRGSVHSGYTYRLPGDGEIHLRFFPRRDTGIRLTFGHVIGGGQLELVNGPSANLVLTREDDDDLYGRWIGCLVDIHALMNPSKLLGTRGLTASTIRPFGFSDAEDFYTEMQYAPGGVHVFTYEFRDDLNRLFTDFLETAFNG